MQNLNMFNLLNIIHSNVKVQHLFVSCVGFLNLAQSTALIIQFVIEGFIVLNSRIYYRLYIICVTHSLAHFISLYPPLSFNPSSHTPSLRLALSLPSPPSLLLCLSNSLSISLSIFLIDPSLPLSLSLSLGFTWCSSSYPTS